MAELALAIIPLGLKTCSGLVSYLGGLKDQDNALARLKRLAESLQGSFHLLDSFLKSGQLDPSSTRAATQALRCLADCEHGLEELKAFGQKISATTAPDPAIKERVKGSYRRLSYPLRQAQLSQLENALDSICTPLNLAIQGLQLEMQATTSNAMVLNATAAKNIALEVSELSAAVSHLTHPVSTIQSQLPSIQYSIEDMAFKTQLMIQTHFKAQINEIRASLQQAESAALQRHVQTAELLSHFRVDGQNPTQAVCRLASRPSALYELTSSASACSCKARRLRTRKTLLMGPLSFKDESVSHFPHFGDCDFYTTASDSSRERTLRFTGLTRLIGRAIELTVRTKVGAGGFSISPSINYFAMVDERNSPAFRVIDLLVESRLGARWAMESYPGLLFESITRKLQVIFRSGKARPTDVNSRGYSLLHHLTLTMNSGDFRILTQQQRAHPSLKSLFDFLIAAGTSVSAVGSDGRLALHIAADEFVLPSSILAQLCVDDVEIPAPRQPELRFGNFGRIDIAKYDGVSRRIAEALYGLLTLAILRNDVREVEDLISRSPECIGEISFYGESPCFVAIEKPEILRLLVKRATPDQLLQPCRIASGMISPLGRAIQLSKNICNIRGTFDGPFYDFSMRNIFGMAVSFNLFIGASTHCKLFLAKQLEMLQQEFEGLAPRTLSRSKIWSSSATEFYVQSNELGCIFQRRAIGELTALPNDPQAEIGWRRARKPISRPIWLDVTCPGDASIFWHRGFSDIDDAWTHQSLSQQAFDAFGPDVSQALHCTSPQYGMWLYNHCPNFWTVICENSRSECARFILAEIIINNRKNLKKYLYRDPLAIEDTDSCTCQCSPEGYTPFTHSIRCLLERYSSDTDELRSFVEELGGMLTMYQHTAVLRQAIFAKLDMVHTCSMRPDFPDEALDDQIYTSIDDGDKAAFIDSVIVEFRRFMLKDADATDCEGENNDMYLFRETREYHQRALKFWDHILPSMMGNFEQTLASTWNPDLEALKDLGVSLWIEEEKKQEVFARVYEVRRDDEESRRMAFKELMDKLEMID
ncbi:hypothetical protein FPCIR_1286 [Fusarium pseudocircinatum]|uniref:Fungal N-terminal domain-containing protein n=1 Tax=Fusarium pseudocircinatum TaxID=56676 RepID=A0A8H5V051_9HYPO|nr:hypothetical protein FPCIR_1286 [Fusarium pseudocircinatum]